MRVGTDARMKAPNGDEIAAKDSMIYLGASIHADGKLGSEINRKIGTARADFKALMPIWKSRRIASNRKVEVFKSLIQSKLMCALASAWLAQGHFRKMDGFQAYALRKILGVPPSYGARARNKKIRDWAKVEPLSKTALASQLRLLGLVLFDPDKDELRKATFADRTHVPLTQVFVRKVGRPKHNWTEQLLDRVRTSAGATRLAKAMESRLEWEAVVARIG